MIETTTGIITNSTKINLTTPSTRKNENIQTQEPFANSTNTNQRNTTSATKRTATKPTTTTTTTVATTTNRTTTTTSTKSSMLKSTSTTNIITETIIDTTSSEIEESETTTIYTPHNSTLAFAPMRDLIYLCKNLKFSSFFITITKCILIFFKNSRS